VSNGFATATIFLPIQRNANKGGRKELLWVAREDIKMNRLAPKPSVLEANGMGVGRRLQILARSKKEKERNPQRIK
jgi:hypothetical protein